MNYGLYLSSAGMLTNLHRQDVASNNLANVNTVGFKRDLVSFRQRNPEVIEDQLNVNASHELMDRLGGGVMVHRSRVDASPGPLSPTGNNTDLGIEGEGFFTVLAPAPGSPAPGTAPGDTNPELQLTRDGRLTISPDGHLVTSTSGFPLMDVNDRPIVVDPTATFQVDEQGGVHQNGAVVARIQLIAVQDPSQLRHLGEGLYEADPQTMIDREPANGRIQQGFVEQSNVDPIAEMLRLIESSRAIGMNGSLIKYHDQVMDSAANVLGRVA